MLRFTLGSRSPAQNKAALAGTYLVGSEGVPLRAEFELRDDILVCAKRADGPASLATFWQAPGCGAYLLETARLLDRDKAYCLPLELVRGRLMRIDQKREDWGLFDYEGFEPLAAELEAARDRFVQAVKEDDPSRQAALADEALALVLQTGDRISRFHADIFLARRKQARAFSRGTFGCTLDLANTAEPYRRLLVEAFDFAALPIPWRLVEPKQQEHNWRPFDAWIEWLVKNRLPVRIGPLVSFREADLPDWLGMYETDYESVRNLIFEHVRRIVERYGNYVQQWEVVSGVHADNTFSFTLEQLMEITRVSVSLVKQLAPRSQAIIDLLSPWGEYYARNQRTIPPMLYAEMIAQSGVGFDGLGSRFVFGPPADGHFLRDMFQISEKLDRLGNFGKPLHITALQVPSAAGAESAGGYWRNAWDENTQALWIREFCEIALSKPFVESITWVDLADRPRTGRIPSGGLVREDMSPKAGYRLLKEVRNALLASARKPPAASRRA